VRRTFLPRSTHLTDALFRNGKGGTLTRKDWNELCLYSMGLTSPILALFNPEEPTTTTTKQTRRRQRVPRVNQAVVL
jgi:hypothetical protein